MRYITPILLLILLVACPKPPDETTCGQGMTLVDETCECVPNSHSSDDGEFCECDSLYHWNEELFQCVLDTTNSQFTWTLDTFGVYSTILRDVEIVDENNIWVVGAIRMQEPDSNGELTIREKYNAAHWDGSEWQIVKILGGNSEVSTFLFFSETDIWVSMGSFPVHWNGFDWTLFHLQNMGLDAHIINSSWGLSPTNIYFAGNEGCIVHYDGTSFTKIGSGTDINLNSVSGTPDGEYVFVSGSNQYTNSIIFQIHNSEVEILYEGVDEWSLPAGTPRSIYVKGDTVYFASGEGIWKYNFTDKSGARISEAGTYESILPHGIFVQTSNDIFMMGARSEFVHFNGVRWSSDFSVWGQFGYSGVGSYGMDVVGNQVIIVGYAESANRGLIARGRRN